MNTANACLVTYNLAAHAFFLLNDNGSAWLGPLAPGTSAVMQNSQCVLNGGSSAATINGSVITVNFGLSFTPDFAGAKNTYLFAGGAWQPAGTWTVMP